MSRPMFLFLFVTLTATIALGQEGAIPKRTPMRKPSRARSRPPEPAISSMALEQSVEAINKARPEVSYDTLSDDAEVVQSSLSEIRYVFIQRGFSNRDAQQATLQGWRDLRTKKLDPDVALSPNDLFKCVTGFGKLFIASLPGGALIEIDGSPARDANNNQETTECVRWTPSGEHRVRLTLVGYEPLEDTCTVVEGKPNKFEKTLRPLEKKN